MSLRDIDQAITMQLDFAKNALSPPIEKFGRCLLQYGSPLRLPLRWHERP